MDWIELTVHTTSAGADMVSEKLMAFGASGTMVEDRADIPDPDKPNGYWEIIDPKMIDQMPEDVVVHAWLEPSADFADRVSALKGEMEAARELFTGSDLGTLQIGSVNVKDEDWSEVWKQFYKPFRAGRTLVVKPTWETYAAEPGDRIIEIDPGMAFGSGMHETTSMCLALLEDAVQPGQQVIDVGTGSGILAIGAALLGAADVLAIDIDPVAVRVAEENIAHNGLSEVIHARQGNLLDKEDCICDVCVANIIADVIIGFAAPLKAHIRPNGLFLCSGIIKEREEEVTQALTNAAYTIEEIRRQGEWVAIRARRPA